MNKAYDKDKAGMCCPHAFQKYPTYQNLAQALEQLALDRLGTTYGLLHTARISEVDVLIFNVCV